jgi:hypothetical protein
MSTACIWHITIGLRPGNKPMVCRAEHAALPRVSASLVLCGREGSRKCGDIAYGWAETGHLVVCCCFDN